MSPVPKKGFVRLYKDDSKWLLKEAKRRTAKERQTHSQASVVHSLIETHTDKEESCGRE